MEWRLSVDCLRVKEYVLADSGQRTAFSHVLYAVRYTLNADRGVYMRLVDTHCHLDFPDYKDDLGALLERASAAGVECVVVPGTSVASSARAAALAAKEKSIFWAAGIHPHEADKAGTADVAKLREMALENDKIVAIGEVGLDHYKGFSDPDNQKKLLRELVALSVQLDLPLILHNREASRDLLDVLDEKDSCFLRGVIHCFSGDEAFLEAVLSRGFYVSFAGNITYEKAHRLRDLAKKTPLEQLLLETDGPYLTPEPGRGKRNEPANVRKLVEIYCGIYGLGAEDIARATTHNANQLFRLGLESADTVSYAIRDSLYINVTHRCTNRCSFCARTRTDKVKGYNIRLDRDPTAEEMIASLGDISRYDAVVFCGFGEPTLRLGALLKVAAYVKGEGKPVRLVTNGEADLIAGRPVAGDLRGLVDKVSVSLNSPDEKEHDHLCRSVFGRRSYQAIIEFVKACRANGIAVEVTCLDLIGEESVNAVRRIAKELDAEFRLRHLDVVG